MDSALRRYISFDPSSAVSRILAIWGLLKEYLRHRTGPLDLPQELRDILLSYLLINSKISFRLTCRSFYDCGPAMTTLIDQVIDSPDLTFERICINERDSSLRPSNRLVCSGCKRLHDKQAFPEGELLKKAEERNCVGRLGNFYYDHGRSVSFQDLLRLTDMALSIPAVSSAWRITTCDSQEYYPHPYGSWERWTKDPVRGIEIYYNWHFYLDYMPMGGRSLNKNSLALKLQSRPIDFCAHLPAHDPRVIKAIKAYHEKWILNRSYQRSGWDRCVDCSKCQTATMMRFDREWMPTGAPKPERLFLTIMIQRRFGFGRSAEDPAWLNQIVL